MLFFEERKKDAPRPQALPPRRNRFWGLIEGPLAEGGRGAGVAAHGGLELHRGHLRVVHHQLPGSAKLEARGVQEINLSVSKGWVQDILQENSLVGVVWGHVRLGVLEKSSGFRVVGAMCCR